MTISDLLQVVAVLLSPLIAVQVTRHLDRRKEARDRKLWIFQTLMASRRYNLSAAHVEALNRIDLEFRDERDVLDAWKAYLDHLNTKVDPQQHWNEKQVERFVELLYTMGCGLGYDYDKTHIKNAFYQPIAHSELEAEQMLLRKGLLEALNRPIQVEIVTLPETNGDDDDDSMRGGSR